MCLTPYERMDKQQGIRQKFPCGKCPVCSSKRVSAWSVRLMHEELISTSAYFITLTYDTSKVPITNNGFLSLKKRDVQLFLKRLRRNHTRDEKRQHSFETIPERSNDRKKNTIKYYAVGEYGGRTKRPHYHIILFNAKLELIQKSWELGYIHFGSVSGASVGYTLKYISKPTKVPIHARDDRQKEFSLMSKGIGKSYIGDTIRNYFAYDHGDFIEIKKETRFKYYTSKVDWHKQDLENRYFIPLKGNDIASMPRYYKEKIYDELEREKIKEAYKRKYQAEAQFRDNYSPEYFAALDAAIRQQHLSQHKNEKL